jgi:hypothetical protein
MNNNENEVFETFWKEIIIDEDGNINMDQLKLELLDFYNMINEVPKVYSAVTGGILSKPTWDAEYVLDYFNEKYGSKAAALEYLADDWDLITADCETNADFKKAIFNYMYIKLED